MVVVFCWVSHKLAELGDMVGYVQAALDHWPYELPYYLSIRYAEFLT